MLNILFSKISPQNLDFFIDRRRFIDADTVFTLGLGSSASRHLVKGVARAGNGLALFSNLNEDLRPKVINLLKNSLMPSLTDVKILWNQDDFSENSKSTPKEQVRTLLGFNTPEKEETLCSDPN